MDTTHCITNPTWELYAANKLAAKELAALQKHADACELCSDIKEGIDAMPNPTLLSEKVTALNTRVDEYLAPKKAKKIPLWYWSAAAVLLISLGIGWWYTQPNPTNTAVVKPNPVGNEKGVDTGIQIQPQKKEVKRETPTITIPQQSTLQKKEGYKNTEVNKEEIADVFIDTSGHREIQTLEFTDYDKTQDNIKPIITSAQQNDVANTDLGKESAPKLTVKKEALPSAMLNNYTNNSYLSNNNAIYWVETSFTQDSLTYSSALKNYNGNLFKQCISGLNSLTSNPKSLYYERALFLNAKALIKQNKNTKAKELLNTVIQLNGALKPDATELLKTLN